jgi:hypothetical protein
VKIAGDDNEERHGERGETPGFITCQQQHSPKQDGSPEPCRVLSWLDEHILAALRMQPKPNLGCHPDLDPGDSTPGGTVQPWAWRWLLHDSAVSHEASCGEKKWIFACLRVWGAARRGDHMQLCAGRCTASYPIWQNPSEYPTSSADLLRFELWRRLRLGLLTIVPRQSSGVGKLIKRCWAPLASLKLTGVLVCKQYRSAWI